ncbi:hypothetical protein Y032_0056g2640 [Ancylostoma ceylanicum]|uniref:Uncharacterized protein n=1 Tax=Ancylostoma ceylanicum TaxID=53326 RepID=A0A016U4L6_9BILA|nr:hypothetical protein Y032_0056g2640 [Ancylostoma ceylanicum]
MPQGDRYACQGMKNGTISKRMGDGAVLDFQPFTLPTIHTPTCIILIYIHVPTTEAVPLGSSLKCISPLKLIVRM